MQAVISQEVTTLDRTAKGWSPRRYFRKLYTLSCGHVAERVEAKGCAAMASRVKCEHCR